MLLKLKKGYGSIFYDINFKPVRLFDGEKLRLLDSFKTKSGSMRAEVLTVGKYSRPIRVEIWEDWLERYEER